MAFTAAYGGENFQHCLASGTFFEETVATDNFQCLGQRFPILAGGGMGPGEFEAGGVVIGVGGESGFDCSRIDTIAGKSSADAQRLSTVSFPEVFGGEQLIGFVLTAKVHQYFGSIETDGFVLRIFLAGLDEQGQSIFEPALGDQCGGLFT